MVNLVKKNRCTFWPLELRTLRFSCPETSSLLGTGYLTACFAVMVGPQGRAVGVEHIPELVDSSVINIQKSAAAQLLKEGFLSMHAGGMLSIAILVQTELCIQLSSVVLFSF